MGGRGTFASGNNVAYTYQTSDFIEGVKVLTGLKENHGLPEEAHKSGAYIKLKHNGIFHEMRLYDKDHYLTLELAYHPEPKIGPKGVPVFHYHTYDRNFVRSEAKKMPKAMRKKYKKYFKGVKL